MILPVVTYGVSLGAEHYGPATTFRADPSSALLHTGAYQSVSIPPPVVVIRNAVIVRAGGAVTQGNKPLIIPAPVDQFELRQLLDYGRDISHRSRPL